MRHKGLSQHGPDAVWENWRRISCGQRPARNSTRWVPRASEPTWCFCQLQRNFMFPTQPGGKVACSPQGIVWPLASVVAHAVIRTAANLGGPGFKCEFSTTARELVSGGDKAGAIVKCRVPRMCQAASCMIPSMKSFPWRRGTMCS